MVCILGAVAWNKKEAAEVLEISRGTLYRKISEYGLEPTRLTLYQNGARSATR